MSIEPRNMTPAQIAAAERLADHMRKGKKD